jgi:hypothetical protein
MLVDTIGDRVTAAVSLCVVVNSVFIQVVSRTGSDLEKLLESVDEVSEVVDTDDTRHDVF